MNHQSRTRAKRNARPFPDDEFADRLERVRKAMAGRGLDGLLVSSPENIFYLTGLDYQGYFAFQQLIVPLEGRPALITRAMEAAIVRDKVPDLHHIGYSDGVAPLPSVEPDETGALTGSPEQPVRIESLRPWSTSLGHTIRGGDKGASMFDPPARAVCDAVTDAGLAEGKLGIEKTASFLPFGIAEAIIGNLPRATFTDASDLVTDCRVVQSPREIEYTRAAARITESMMLAGIAAAGPGVRKRDVLAAIYQTMFSRGGTNPGFVPLVRSTSTLEHEHGPWEDDTLQRQDILFMEMSGCAQRYHAPMTRLVFIGKAPARTEAIRKVCEGAIEAAQQTIRPGVLAGEVYDAWQQRVRAAGISGYERHHCGYLVGIGYPPSWSGSGVPMGLRRGSGRELRAGMVFHLFSWLVHSGKGDFVISDTALVTGTGCDILTNVSRGLLSR